MGQNHDRQQKIKTHPQPRGWLLQMINDFDDILASPSIFYSSSDSDPE
jgi:hypothetical protein